MAQHTSDSIERTALELLRQAGALSAPVDLDKVVAALGAKVHHETLEDEVSGVLIVKGGEKHVLVNAAHHPNRQRFTIGHELGHLVLHDGQGDRLIIDKQIRVYQRVGEATSGAYSAPGSITKPYEEREANMFAAALLMPAPLVQHAALEHDLGDELDITALAKTFGVSEQAMFIRLQQLGVVEVALGKSSATRDDAQLSLTV